MRWLSTSLLAALLSALCVLAVHAAQPISPHVAITCAPSRQTVFSLPGYDADGDRLVVTITSLPRDGRLYQLSRVFSERGVEPAIGVPVALGDRVTGSGSRLVYVPPERHKQAGMWSSFTYSVRDATQPSRRDGIVSLVGSDRAVVASDFLRDAEGWTVVNNGRRGVGAMHERSSRGRLSYYIYSFDDDIFVATDPSAPSPAAVAATSLPGAPRSGSDKVLWYFVAPAKFLGNQAVMYGGKLEFTMSSSSGDLRPESMNDDLNAVVLECDSCASNTGIRLAVKASSLPAFTGADTLVSIDLTEKGGWVKDPKNTLLQWQQPTQCEVAEVLEGITALRILGDYSKWYESVAIDNVVFKHGPGVPIPCYASF